MVSKSKITSAFAALGKIKGQWESLWKEVDKFNQDLNVFYATNLPVASKIKAETLMKSWNKFTEKCEKFYDSLDVIIAESRQIEQIEVKLPWDEEDFRESWSLWVEYLNEQHNIICGSRTQIIQLKTLVKLSTGDKSNAIKIIEASMTNFYKSFYPLTDTPKQNNKKHKIIRKDDDFS